MTSARPPNLAPSAQQDPSRLQHNAQDLHNLANAAHNISNLEPSASKQALLAQAAAESVQNHMGGLSQNALNLKRSTPEDVTHANGSKPVKQPRYDSTSVQVCVTPRDSGAEAAGGEAEECEESPFALMWIRYKMPRPFNHGAFGVKLLQVVKGDIKLAVVSNYMIDFKWLVTACPDLLNASQLVLVHGDNQQGLTAQMSEVGVPASCKVCFSTFLLNVLPPQQFFL